MKINNLLNKKLFLICFFLFITSFSYTTFVNAAPPVTTVVSGNTNVQIIHMPFDTIRQNETLYVRFWTFNGTTGSLLKNTSVYCTINLLKPQGRNILRANVTRFGNSSNLSQCLNCFMYDINAQNFSETGLYGLNLRCETYDGITLGGDTMIPLQVTPSGTGSDYNIAFFIILLLLIYAVSFIGFFGKNVWVSMLGGILMLALGIYLIREGIIIYRDWLTVAVSYLTLGLGVVFTLIPIIEFIEKEID
jgi:hypothetical protein